MASTHALESGITTTDGLAQSDFNLLIVDDKGTTAINDDTFSWHSPAGIVINDGNGR